MIWGTNAKDGQPPVRVEDAHVAIVSKREFRRIARMPGSRAPSKVHPRPISKPYLLSGLAKCETCREAMTAAEAKSGKYTYYICHSLLKRGKGTCKTPRLNSKRFEKIIVDELRANILTEPNIRDLVKIVDEEMDTVGRLAARQASVHRGRACGRQETSRPHLERHRDYRYRDGPSVVRRTSRTHSQNEGQTRQDVFGSSPQAGTP